MKKIIIVCFALILFIGCEQDDEVNTRKGSVQFSLNEKTEEGGRISENSQPSFVLLSVKDQNGNFIEQNKKLTLYSFGNGYVSESLQLLTGNYELTQFIVLDASSKVIYATPVEGSELAQYVNDPLPILFIITENGSTLITPQVLAVTEENTPESFGYVSFGFKIIPSGLLRQIQTFDQGILRSQTDFYYDAEGKAKYSVSRYFSGLVNSSPILSDSSIYSYSPEVLKIQSFDDFYQKDIPKTKEYIYQGGLLKLFRSTGSYDGTDFQYEYMYSDDGTIQKSYQKRLNRNGEVQTGIGGYRVYEYETNDERLITAYTIYQADTEGTIVRKDIRIELTYDSGYSPLLTPEIILPNTTRLIKHVRSIEYNLDNTIRNTCESGYEYFYDSFNILLTRIDKNPAYCYITTEPDDGIVHKYIYK